MNDTLIEQIKTRANVSEDAAREAAEAVAAFLEEKLPESIGPKVVGVLKGESSAGDQIKDAVSGKLGGVGKMFGK